jgi:hypothetical protein
MSLPSGRCTGRVRIVASGLAGVGGPHSAKPTAGIGRNVAADEAEDSGERDKVRVDAGGTGAANTASLRAATSCQPELVTFGLQPGWCRVNVAELL